MTLYWEPYCQMWDTPTERPDIKQLSWEHECIERGFWGAAVPFIHARMKSRRTGNVGEAQPQSVLNVLRNVRRELQRPGKKTVSLEAAVRACDGLLREYIDEHGQDALLPHRKEPLTNEIIVALLSDGMQDKAIGPRGRVVDWSAAEFSSLRAMFATLAQTGMRKSEVSIPDKGKWTRRFISFDNVKWSIGGIVYKAPTLEQLAALREGDFALLRPPPSKADQFGLHWGASTIYLPYHPNRGTHPVCAARELAREEMRRAVPAIKRIDTPLFAREDGQAWCHSALADTFERMLKMVVGAERVKHYSMHSWRIYLACALLAAGASNGTIQAMLRWRSEDALKIYARVNGVTYGSWLDIAAIASVASVRTTTDGGALGEPSPRGQQPTAPTVPQEDPGTPAPDPPNRTKTGVAAMAAAMKVTAESGIGDAEAGFTSWWLGRAQSVSTERTLEARSTRPTTDADAAVAMFQQDGTRLLAACAAADIVDNARESGRL